MISSSLWCTFHDANPLIFTDIDVNNLRETIDGVTEELNVAIGRSDGGWNRYGLLVPLRVSLSMEYHRILC